MQNITSTEKLKEAIQILEEEYYVKEQELRKQLFVTYSSLKPFNILKNTLKEITSPTLIEEISGSGIGLIGGFLSRKIFVGTSGNVIRKVLGSLLQLGVTAVVSQNSGIIHSAGMSLIQRLIQRHKMTPESRVI
jgi:hypothetical protein